ncbi:sulfatase family protein [Nocardioides coralli]|uniref:sulfatase family protein n=1 Tax=Nocardioides coralli TaxID=2872154 RepID=UPI001CA3DA9B|nr:sulfatase [Nocardioides coralli]QZY30451.1 sulfatase [Nocardioides coralli]
MRIPPDPATPAAKRPNVVWISTHDINPDLGAYRGVWPGAEYADSPHLDDLAAQGAVYSHAFSSAPVCAPSRAAIMTGCHPSAVGTLPMRTKAVPPPDVRLLSEYFREAGYYTTCTTFTDFQVQTPPVAFDDWGDEAHWRNRPTPDTPFFASFHSSITHESRLYVPDEEFAGATADVPEEFRHDPAAAPLPPYYPDTEAFRETWARYADLVTQMDHWVGDLLQQLEDDGLADDTVVVFWSDHGVGMPRAKRWLREAGLRVPLILRWPGMVSPSLREELVHTMDLAATMLAVCGIPVPPSMHARAFLDAEGRHLEPNEAVYGARARIDEQDDSSLTVRDRRYRYVRHAHPDRSPMQHSEYPERFATWRELRRLAFEDAKAIARGEPAVNLTDEQRSTYLAGRSAEELYDLEADPHELHNLVDDPAHAADLERLRELLDQWQSRYADPWPIPEAALLEQWRPGGVPQTTATPVVLESDGELTVTCETPGASIGWTTDQPGTPLERTEVEVLIGSPEDDGRRWHLYTGPFRPPAVPVSVAAWRLGFEASDEVLWEPPKGAER